MRTKFTTNKNGLEDRGYFSPLLRNFFRDFEKFDLARPRYNGVTREMFFKSSSTTDIIFFFEKSFEVILKSGLTNMQWCYT